MRTQPRICKRKYECLTIQIRSASSTTSWVFAQGRGEHPGSVNKNVMLGNALSRWLPSLEAFRPGWILTTGCLIITTVLRIAARFTDKIPTDFWPRRALSQLTILWSVTLMAIAMLSVVRAHALEPVFGALDRSVRFHRILGPSAILLLIAHVILLTVLEFHDGSTVGDVFIPFWSESTRSIDIFVFYCAFTAWRACL